MSKKIVVEKDKKPSTAVVSTIGLFPSPEQVEILDKAFGRGNYEIVFVPPETYGRFKQDVANTVAILRKYENAVFVFPEPYLLTKMSYLKGRSICTKDNSPNIFLFRNEKQVWYSSSDEDRIVIMNPKTGWHLVKIE